MQTTKIKSLERVNPMFGGFIFGGLRRGLSGSCNPGIMSRTGPEFAEGKIMSCVARVGIAVINSGRAEEMDSSGPKRRGIGR